jgi:flagellar hook-associated protein 1 FlgK
MSWLSIGASGMSVNQQELNLTGQNLTNASNPAYHRQEAILATLPNLSPQDGGVQIAQIQRAIDATVETEINRNASASSDTTRQLQTLTQVQSAVNPTDGSLADALTAFYTAAQELTATPDDPALREAVVNAGQSLTTQLNQNALSLQSAGADIVGEASTIVTQINSETKQIAALNASIQAAVTGGESPNTLEDQRDSLINQLSQQIGIQTIPQGNGVVSVLAGSASLVVGTDSIPISAKLDNNNQLAVYSADPAHSVSFSGGTLGALQTLRNQLLPAYGQQLDGFAHQLVQTIDEIHATGIPLVGAFTSLTGTRGATSATASLGQSLAYPPQAGTLSISVTDAATGARTTRQVDIDPSESLNQVAAALSAIPHLSANVDSISGKLSISADSGYQFDFAGRPATSPDTQSITGTSTVQVSGNYTGTSNDTLSYKVVGSGTVGVTPGLSLQVTDSSGALLGTLPIGQGYAPGSTLTVNGISVALQAGTVNDGDTFSVKAIDQPDTSGILASLGINSFFTGTGASGLAVNADLLQNPGAFAASGTGGTGDSSVLAKLIATQTQAGSNGNTLSQSLANLNGDVAEQIQSLTLQQTDQSALTTQLTTQQQSISGVDPNAELVNMLQFQRGFQMSAQFISTVNQAMDSLLAILQ